jgi:sucrose-6-phosphate hydrolase SacC (GH32 family)
VGDAGAFGFSIGDLDIVYDVKKQELRSKDKVAPLAPKNGVVSLELLVDRLSVEVFANGGEVYMPMASNTVGQPREIISRGGTTTIRSLEVIELKSAWK